MKRMCTGTNNTSYQTAQGGILGKKMSRRDVLYLGATAGIAGALSGGIVLSEGAINPAHAASSATISVSGTQWGVSTAYIGATEGDVRFNTADMSDLGINTYRIYGGMSRWEWQDPYSTYGTPTIDQIKANPNVINWTWWDNAMTNPPNGSDYWWSNGPTLWQGNARTIFANLQSAGIRPVVTVRTRTSGYYAMRLGIRGLQGARPTYQSTTSNSNLQAITTKDSAGHVYLLVTNSSVKTAYTVDADLSALISSGTGTMWQFDSTHMDVVVGSPALSNGHVTFTVPGTSAVLLKF